MARARRQSSAWNRTDSLVTLASYLDRPGRLTVPPRAERERIADILRHDVDAVSLRMWMYAGLDERNPSSGEPAGERETRLWNTYSDDRVQCMLDAEEALDGFKRVPHHLS